jgi:uncharacterized protein (DUF362 family)
MPTVSISRLHDKHRSMANVDSILREVLDRLGGFDAFVKPGQSVLIKPDQSVPQIAEEGSTTDPLLVAGLIRMAHEAGASKVLVGASSSGFLDSLRCMQATGVAAIAQREGAELIDLGSEHIPSREIHLTEGRRLRSVRLPAPLIEAEVVIAVPKAKTDYLDTISGSLDFCAGGINQKLRAVLSSEADMLDQFADIMTVVRPDLCIVDALICGEGDGPDANWPRWCGCILASADPVALDVSISTLLGRDPDTLHFAGALEQRGLGSRAPIVFLGTPLERVAFRAWPAHAGFDHLPVNVLIGKGVTPAGTIGHVKGALETLVRQGVLPLALNPDRTPTIMIGEVEDPAFERHIQEGSYIVFDDAALPKYKNDARVHFVPGHPVLDHATPELMGILAAENANSRKYSGAPSAQRVSTFKFDRIAAAAGLTGAAFAALLGLRRPDKEI